MLYNEPAGTYSLTATDANGNIARNSFILVGPPALHVDTLNSPTTPGGYNIHCTGGWDGSINLVVSGGTPFYDNYGEPSYQFTWDNGAFHQNPSGLSAGTYNVRIVDGNGAEVDTSITLTEPNPLGDVLNIAVYATPSG